MNCGRVSNQLSAYIDRELTGIEMLQIRSHLSGCDRCRSEHEALCRMKMMLGRLRSLEPPPTFVGEAVQRFRAFGAQPGSAGAWGKRARWLLVATRLSQALEAAGAPLPGVRAHALDAPRFARRLLGLLSWQPLTRGLVAATLAAALILTAVILHQPRHADTVVASTPPAVILGEDQDSPNPPQFSGRAPGEFTLRDVFRDRLPDGQASLPWVPVSFQGETSWTFR